MEYSLFDNYKLIRICSVETFGLPEYFSCHASFVILRSCMIKVLLIAPLYGRKKPELSSNVEEVNKLIHNFENMEMRGNFKKDMAAIQKVHQEKNKSRGLRRRSKVRYILHVIKYFM